MVELIGKGSCIAVTDRSYDPETNLATACWIIEDDKKHHQAKGASQTPGNGTDMDAYRAELYGIYCILLCMKYICDEYKLQTGKIKILCDCKGSLTRSIIYNNRPTTRHPNYDLLWSIFDIRDNLEIDVNWEHVKGHQDDANLDRELTHFEKITLQSRRRGKGIPRIRANP